MKALPWVAWGSVAIKEDWGFSLLSDSSVFGIIAAERAGKTTVEEFKSTAPSSSD